MPNKKKRVFIIVAVVFVVLVVLFILLAWQFPMIIMAASLKAQVKRLNNPYINNDYANWKEVVLFDKHSFSLPETWEIVEQDESTCLLRQDGQTVAYVGLVGGSSRYADDKSLFTAATQRESKNIRFEALLNGEHFGNGCQAYKIILRESSTQKEVFFGLEADPEGNPTCEMIFINGIIDEDALKEYVIAVAYSYVYLPSIKGRFSD